MHEIEATVRELLAAAQAERKAKLDAGRVDTVFAVGDRALLRTKELFDVADIGKTRQRWDGPFTVTARPSPNAYNIGKTRQRWDGPFTVTARPSPNAYNIALPRRMRCSSTVNVDRLKPYFARAADLQPPGPSTDAGQEGEHEVELLLNRRTVRGVTHY
jgi:hypothetical protein